MAGPLEGLRVVVLGGIGPAPFCGMLLADLGADVLRIDRAGGGANDPMVVLTRGQKSIFLNLKDKNDVETAKMLLAKADVAIEGFRPGATERLGLGPDHCAQINPRLIYARMTGWGQTGPLAQAPGHDINYIALSGALHAIGQAGGPPVVPLNLIGDFGGGGLYMAFGILAAIYERTRSGKGQVIDAAMLDGAALLMTGVFGLRDAGLFDRARGQNQFDGGAHFYTVYQCADGRYLSIGAYEPQFYASLLEACDIHDPAFDRQFDGELWPDLKDRLAKLFITRTRDEWTLLLEGTNACVSPILDFDEAPNHPHNMAREVFVEVDGVIQPAPGPRFSRTPASTPGKPPRPGEHTEQVLKGI